MSFFKILVQCLIQTREYTAHLFNTNGKATLSYIFTYSTKETATMT